MKRESSVIAVTLMILGSAAPTFAQSDRDMSVARARRLTTARGDSTIPGFASPESRRTSLRRGDPIDRTASDSDVRYDYVDNISSDSDRRGRRSQSGSMVQVARNRFGGYEDYPSAQRQSGLLRVVSGLIRTHSAARAEQDRLYRRGVSAAIINSGTGYRLQFGAFQSRSNAERTLQEAHDAGSDAMIYGS